MFGRCRLKNDELRAKTRDSRRRIESLTNHYGRTTFIAHALARGRTLAKVRDWTGHVNVTITSEDLHVALEENNAILLSDTFSRQAIAVLRRNSHVFRHSHQRCYVRGGRGS
jgi:hypothetical protein